MKKSALFLSFSIGASLLVFGLSGCKWLEPKHPKQGTVPFGAKEKPKTEIPAQMGSFKSIFADIAQSVIPTVVSVIPTKVDTVTFYRNPFYHFFGERDEEGSPFDFFFGRPNRPKQQREEPQIEKRQYKQQGIGSGVIVSEKGYILTNYHVVNGADEIKVRLSDGRTFEAKVQGADSLSDVAVVKINEDAEKLPVAYLGDSDKLRPGDWAIAVGNPFSLTSTVTVGIISALGRKVDNSNTYQNFIQTDAAINPGNSGGALVNINGELIGINTMIYTRSGGYMGIGFAVPINMARRIMEDLIYKGRVERGWLGVSIQDIDQNTRDALNLCSIKGVLIAEVYKNQPADKAGIKKGDIIVSIGGTRVESANELRNLVAGIRPGNKVKVRLFRNGKEMDLDVFITERDEKRLAKLSNSTDKKEETAGKNAKSLGIEVGNLTPELREEFGVEKETHGVVVLDVDPQAADAYEQLKRGDVITQIKSQNTGFQNIENTGDFLRATKGFKNGESALLSIERNGNSFFVAFKVRK